MKLVFLLLALFTFHAQASELICWEAQSQVVAGIPQEICVDSVERQGSRLEVRTEDNVYTTEKLELLDSDSKQYVAEASFVEDYEVCGRSILSTLSVVAQQRFSSSEEYWTLEQIEVRYAVTPDSCHSRPKKGVIKYQLKY